MQICSFISPQPKEFPWKYDINSNAHAEYVWQLRQAVAVAVDFDNITMFYCGLEHSADLDFAEAVLYQKQNKYHDIKLVCVLSRNVQYDDYIQKDIERYNSILQKADGKQLLICTNISKYLIDNCQQVIFVWDEKQTGEMWNNILHAVRQEKYTYFIRLNDIKDYMNEPNGD